MSVRMSPGRLTAMLVLLAGPVSASATQSIWSNHAPNVAAQMTGDYRNASCPKKPPAAYTGHLQLDSKYDQSDASKSRLVARQSKDTERIRQQVKHYIGGLVKATQVFQRTRKADEATTALACLNQWLDAWAGKSALLSDDASKTGVASRKWALAAIASTLLKVQALSDQRYQLSAVQARWLGELSAKVMAEYEPRRYDSGIYFNNHDYWAAWAVAASGMLVQRDDFIRWADGNLRRGLQQAVRSGDGSYAYLPLEVARARLAATYSQYALVPLVLLAESARANGLPWSEHDQQTLELLGNFAARTVLDSGPLPELMGQAQTEVAPYKLAWLIPFLYRAPNNRLARQLYESEDGNVDNYSQIGGPLKPFYPPLP